jgi:hypothetical protein
MYRELDPTHVIDTAARLRRRVDERFPGSGLGRVAAELESVTREAASLSAWMARPNWPLRAAVLLTVLALVVVLIALGLQVKVELRTGGWSDLVQGLEALINDLVFFGIGIYFLVGLEVRQKRKRVLSALHVLRSLAHIVDMHQLTKDPERVFSGGPNTASSPVRSMTPFELVRYLDYSSEMLAIVSKVAGIYVQNFSDPVTIDAASAVEELTVGLSRAIWQKIVIMDRFMDPVTAEAIVEPN